MTPRDWALLASALLNVGLLLVVAWLCDRLHAERKQCRHECPLIETVQRQLASLSYAWNRIDQHEREKRAKRTIGAFVHVPLADAEKAPDPDYGL